MTTCGLLLDRVRDNHPLPYFCINDATRLRLSTLQKSSGGARGIVAGKTCRCGHWTCIITPASASPGAKLKYSNPPMFDELENRSRSKPVWLGSHLPLVRLGITVLGTPLGNVEFVQAHLQKTLADHDTLLSRIPLLDNTQSAVAVLCQEPIQLFVEIHQT